MNFSREINGGFSLIELLIALSISAFVLVGVYSMVSGVIITKEGIDRVNDDMRVVQTFQRVIARDIRMMYSRAVNNLPPETREREIIFSLYTQNSLRFNKSIPVEVIYTLEEGILYRTERRPDMDYIMKMPIIRDISEMTVESYDGREYRDNNIRNTHNIFRFSFYYREKPTSFVTGRLVGSTGE